MRIYRVLIAALFAFSLPVFAAPVTLESDWKVLYVSDANGSFNNIFQVGANMSMSTTFDPATPDVDPSVNRGQYDGAISVFTLTVGSSVFSGSGSIIIRDHGPNGYLFGQQTTVTTPSLVAQFSFNSNSDLAQQPSAALQWLAAAPPRIDSSGASINFGGSTVGFIQSGNYRLAEVPVPGAMLLFNSALALALVGRRRLSRRA